MAPVLPVHSGELSDGVTVPEGQPWAQRWLVELIGVDYFDHVTTVQFPTSCEPADSTIARVGSLTRLRNLCDYSSSLSDAGLAHLTGMTALEDLELSGAPVSDAGLAQLAGPTKLHSLVLSDTQVTDAGLIHLKSMKRLSALSMRHPGHLRWACAFEGAARAQLSRSRRHSRDRCRASALSGPQQRLESLAPRHERHGCGSEGPEPGFTGTDDRSLIDIELTELKMRELTRNCDGTPTTCGYDRGRGLESGP
jgi:hypothetical protein